MGLSINSSFPSHCGSKLDSVLLKLGECERLYVRVSVAETVFNQLNWPCFSDETHRWYYETNRLNEEKHLTCQVFHGDL